MKINTINHIEVSSLCSNSCQYCPASKVWEHRNTGLMTKETFDKVIEFMDVLVARGTQTEVNLHGIGEPTLNPLLVDFVKVAREHIPPRFNVHINTNGNHMTDELAEGLKKAGINSIDITAHKPYNAATCIRILSKHTITGSVSLDFVMRPHDWAGQVDWFKADYSIECGWLKNGMVMVLWDGTIVSCGIDAFATKKLGNVHDGPAKCEQIELEPFDLCKKCHHYITKEVVPNGPI